MAHPLHDLTGIGGADRVGAEGVAEVVEAQIAEAGLLERGLIPVAELVAGEVAALDSAEDEIVVGSELVALAEGGESFRDLLGHRDGALLAALRGIDTAVGEALADVNGAVGEVHVAPAQSQQLPQAQPRERGREVDRAVLLRGRNSDEGQDLLPGEDVDVAALRVGSALDIRDRIRRQLVAALRPDEEAVQHGQVLVDGPVREVFGHQGVAEAFDHLRRHLLEAHLVSELLAEDLLHPVDHVLVVDLGRELDLPVSLVVEPVVASDGEGGPGADHSRQLAAPRLGERFVQPRPRRGLRVVAGGRLDLAVGPVRADPPLDLASVRKPVLRVPLRAAFTLHLEDVAADRSGRLPLHRVPSF